MKQSTLEKRIKEGKRQPKRIELGNSELSILFIEAPNKNYISYLNFQDGYGGYIASLDPEENRKELRQLERWIKKCLENKKQ